MSRTRVGVADGSSLKETLSAPKSTGPSFESESTDSAANDAVEEFAKIEKSENMTWSQRPGQQKDGPVAPNVERILRHGFIRKVYGILGAQLLVTFGMIAAFQTETMRGNLFQCVPNETGKPVRPDFDAAGEGGYISATCPDTYALHATGMLTSLYYFSVVVSFAALLMLTCCIQNARVYPRNYALLSAFTVAEGLMLSIICVFYQSQIVMLAAAMTAVITIGLSLFACQTRIDFTGAGPYLYAGLSALFWLGILSWFFPMPSGLHLFYLVGGVILFSFYLVYDTQLIVGGEHKKYQIGYDDYVFAAIAIYLDIINLFILILQLLSERD